MEIVFEVRGSGERIITAQLLNTIPRIGETVYSLHIKKRFRVVDIIHIYQERNKVTIRVELEEE